LNQEVDGDGGRLVMTTEDDAVSGTGYSTPKLTREALGDFGFRSLSLKLASPYAFP